MLGSGPHLPSSSMPPALPPPLEAATFIVAGLAALNWIRHSDRSLISTVSIGLGFGFVGLLGLMTGSSYLAVVLHVPQPDSILLCLFFLFASLQTVLTVQWVSSPPKRLWH